MHDLSRLSLNQATIQRWSLPDAIEGCARHGIGHIGVWRDKLAAQPAVAVARQLRDAQIRVSSICRGGFFSAATAAERLAAIEDNRRAIEECVAIESPLLVLVCGPAKGQTLIDARAATADAIAALEPFARSHNVHLGIEPLHPMYAAERSVVVTLAQANTLAERIASPHVGVVVDVFHLWWDPDVRAQILRAAPHMLAFHVSDWLVPLPDMLLGRGLMGDGVIDIRALRELADEAAYTGPIEVEIFNQQLWDRDPDDALAAVCAAYLDHL